MSKVAFTSKRFPRLCPDFKQHLLFGVAGQLFTSEHGTDFQENGFDMVRMCPRPCLDLPILSLRAAGKHPSG